jgi:hypothetical protein
MLLCAARVLQIPRFFKKKEPSGFMKKKPHQKSAYWGYTL